MKPSSLKQFMCGFLLNQDLIKDGVLIQKAGEWLIWPMAFFDDGLGGITWSERVGVSYLGIEAKFYKKKKSGRVLYKQV